MTDKPNCYDCKYRGTIPGDEHSCCTAPDKNNARIKGSEYGQSQGWFVWPFNFDPVWLEECNLFKNKELNQ